MQKNIKIGLGVIGFSFAAAFGLIAYKAYQSESFENATHRKRVAVTFLTMTNDVSYRRNAEKLYRASLISQVNAEYVAQMDCGSKTPSLICSVR
ncbi:hypothetical protein [Jeongeupia sp. USM3]|uniref:hypothetical protein n=1 Tax=Jeongeupia sp. USM3 TaxID=1906741 RepID=UPI0011AB7374|nr:hypothetical protein [Jeongeupia sp. USM3]